MFSVPHFVSHRARRPLAACALLLAHCHTQGQAQDDATLPALINAYRAQPLTCSGAAAAGVPALARNRVLARLDMAPGVIIAPALEKLGYFAERADGISVTGAPDAATVMDTIRAGYCAVLRDGAYTELGVRRTGDDWTIVLAQPLVPLRATLPPWRDAGRFILAASNAARAQGRQCGDRYYGAAPALAWSGALADAAHAHSSDMAQRAYFSHTGKDGGGVIERAARQGYRYVRLGENIAFGQRTAQDVVDGWLASPAHCANLMSAEFHDMGAAYALRGAQRQTAYWTQVLGTAR